MAAPPNCAYDSGPLWFIFPRPKNVTNTLLPLFNIRKNSTYNFFENLEVLGSIRFKMYPFTAKNLYPIIHSMFDLEKIVGNVVLNKK